MNTADNPTVNADLAARQAALVAALVAGGPLPDGFDPRTVGIAAQALRSKRAGEVARAWPALAASLGDEWPKRFMEWAHGRTPGGSLLDGWAFALDLLGTDAGPGHDALRRELAEVEAVWVRRSGVAVRRRGPAVRRAPGRVVFQLFGRVLRLGRAAPM